MCQGVQLDVWYSMKLEVSFRYTELFNDLIEELTTEAIELEGARTRTDTRQATSTALSVMLANLIYAYRRDPEISIGIPMGAGDYPRGILNPFNFGYRAMRRVVNYLTSSDPPLVTLVQAQADREEGPRHVTRIRATQALIERTRDYTREVSDGSLSITCNASEGEAFLPGSNQLFEKAPLPIIRLKNEQKQLIDFEDTEQTNLMRQQLQGWNDFANLHWIDLLLPNDAFLEVVNPRLPAPNDTEGVDNVLLDQAESLYFPDISLQKNLYRVFNNSSFDQGGRLYGGWWQSIPSEYRRYITINWVPTVELDYSNMMIAMLYSREGRALEGDAYALDGVDAAFRGLLKETLFKLINATGRVRAPRRDALPPEWTWRQIQEALAERHAPIADHFSSGIGLELQRLDSEIAMSVLMRCQQDDRLVLPVHDSFITYMGHQNRLNDIMLTAYREQLGGNIGIDPNEAFIVRQFPEEFGEPDAEIYHYEDYVRDLEQQRDYSGYLARKQDFQRRQTNEWMNRFRPG